jgi:hypothetical protein
VRGACAVLEPAGVLLRAAGLDNSVLPSPPRPACTPAQPEGAAAHREWKRACMREPEALKGVVRALLVGGGRPLVPRRTAQPTGVLSRPRLLRRNTRGAVLRRGRGVACVRHKVAFAQKARDRGHGHADAHHKVLGHSACVRVVRNDVLACCQPGLGTQERAGTDKGQQRPLSPRQAALRHTHAPRGSV